MQPKKIPPFSSSRETPIAQPKQFTQEEIDGRYFQYGYRDLAGNYRVMRDKLVILGMEEDGFCRVAECIDGTIKNLGLAVFSGFMEPRMRRDPADPTLPKVPDRIGERFAAKTAQLRKEGL